MQFPAITTQEQESNRVDDKPEQQTPAIYAAVVARMLNGSEFNPAEVNPFDTPMSCQKVLALNVPRAEAQQAADNWNAANDTEGGTRWAIVANPGGNASSLPNMGASQ